MQPAWLTAARTGPSHANPSNRHRSSTYCCYQPQGGAARRGEALHGVLESKFCVYQQQKLLVCTGQYYLALTLEFLQRSSVAIQAENSLQVSTKNQHTKRKFLNFENWGNGELSKIGLHLKMDVIKQMSITQNVNLNWYSSMKN